MTNDYIKIHTTENRVKTWGEMTHFQSRNQNDNNKGENTTVDNCWLSNPIFPQKKRNFKEFALPPAGAEIGGKTFSGYKEMFFNEAPLTEAREVRRINGSLTRNCCEDGLFDGVPQSSHRREQKMNSTWRSRVPDCVCLLVFIHIMFAFIERLAANPLAWK